MFAAADSLERKIFRCSFCDFCRKNNGYIQFLIHSLAEHPLEFLHMQSQQASHPVKIETDQSDLLPSLNASSEEELNDSKVGPISEEWNIPETAFTSRQVFETKIIPFPNEFENIAISNESRNISNGSATARNSLQEFTEGSWQPLRKRRILTESQNIPISNESTPELATKDKWSSQKRHILSRLSPPAKTRTVIESPGTRENQGSQSFESPRPSNTTRKDPESHWSEDSPKPTSRPLRALKKDAPKCQHNFNYCHEFPKCAGRNCPRRHPPCPIKHGCQYNDCPFFHREHEMSCHLCPNRIHPRQLAPVLRHCPHLKRITCSAFQRGSNHKSRECQGRHGLCLQEHCHSPHNCHYEHMEYYYFCFLCRSK